MEMLADIALENNNVERARTILERAQSVLPGDQYPRLTLRLARLYDEYTPVRDYRRAVQLYRKAARQLEESDSEAARNARKRADYLTQNYVNFGTE
jgi:predicted Zn-dependent protease